MREYQTLREHWIRELQSRGEFPRLRRPARDVLERGSLAVFCSMLLADLDRRWRRARHVRTGAALLLGVALLGLAASCIESSLPIVPAAAVAEGLCRFTSTLGGAGLVLLLLGHVASVRAARRRALYERFERAVDPATNRFGL